MQGDTHWRRKKLRAEVDEDDKEVVFSIPTRSGLSAYPLETLTIPTTSLSQLRKNITTSALLTSGCLTSLLIYLSSSPRLASTNDSLNRPAYCFSGRGGNAIPGKRRFRALCRNTKCEKRRWTVMICPLSPSTVLSDEEEVVVAAEAARECQLCQLDSRASGPDSEGEEKTDVTL